MRKREGDGGWKEEVICRETSQERLEEKGWRQIGIRRERNENITNRNGKGEDGGDGDGAEYVMLRGRTRITRQSCIGCVDAAFRLIKGRYTI
jgi:hypothetical protein